MLIINNILVLTIGYFFGYFCHLLPKPIMSNIEFKAKIVNHSRELQMKAIANLKAEVNEAQKSANDYGAPKDRYDSFRTQMLRKRDMFAKQLLKAEEQLSALNKIPLDKPIQSVEFGSIVITDKQKLFVSVGLGKMEVEGQTIFAISPIVPIVNALRGKTKGETIVFNGRKINIMEVY